MIKLVLWDYSGESSAWCKKYLQPNAAEIARTLKPDDPDQAEVILRGDWDYVLIFADDNSREVFDEILSTMRAMNFSMNKIIFALSISSWVENPAALYSLLNPTTVEKVYRWFNYVNHRKWNRYTACDTEEISYVGTSADECIIGEMYINRDNFAADEMKTFHALAKKYYGTNNGGGCFWTWARTSARREFISSRNSLRI